MMKGKKIFACLALVSVLVVPNILATGLGTSSSDVKVGKVEDNTAIYNVDLKWGSLVYNFVKQNGESEYKWIPNEENSDLIEIINKSNVAVNANVEFDSSLAGVTGSFAEGFNGEVYTTAYRLLTEKPEDFNTGNYYEIDENRNFIKVSETSIFEANKYYGFVGAGGGVEAGPLPAYIPENEDGDISVSHANWKLVLQGGNIETVEADALIGTVSVTLS